MNLGIDFFDLANQFIGTLPVGYGFEIIYPIITIMFIMITFLIVISPIFLVLSIARGRR